MITYKGTAASASRSLAAFYLVEAVPAPSTPNDSKGLHLGMDLAARVRHAGLSRARHEQEVPICALAEGAQDVTRRIVGAPERTVLTELNPGPSGEDAERGRSTSRCRITLR